MRSRLVSSLLPVATLLLASTPFTQAAVQNRVVHAVNNASRVSLSGTISGRAKHSVDLGLAPGGRKLTSLSLMSSMTAAQQADLNQLLAAQLDPASPSYHEWLTPEQFGARFGLSSSDLAKVSSWLTSQGFTITSVARSSNFIEFSGTVAQAQQAFGASIHTVTFNGEQHIANLTEVALPSAIASVVASVNGLDDFHAKPRSRPRTVSPVDPTKPLYTQTTCPNSPVPCHYISPEDLYTIYNYTPLNNASTPINGSGVTIAVLGQTDLTTGNVLPDTNIAAFRTAAGLPAINLQLKLSGTDPGVTTGDVDEAHIDIEWSGASAPGATIAYVYGVDVFKNALPYAVTNKVAPIITASYGLCEPAWSTASVTTINQLLAQANVQGQTVVNAAGDSGATDCDATGHASEGQTADFPSSSPYVTSAGGTMFSGDVASPGTYWNGSNPANGGSALSYIPEQPWNETTASNGLDDGGAGGGGASAFFSKPAWQTGLGVPNDSTRDLPDISMNAAAQHDGYLVCSQGGFSGETPCTSGFLSSGGQVNVFGGTSFVAPIFAGVLARVEQQLGILTAGIGNVGPKLYGFLNGPTYSSVFHDIITGNNSVPCSQGTPNCQNGGSTGFNAGTGYDQASGIGSFDVSKLVNGWSAVTPTGTGGTIGSNISATTLTTTNALCAVSAGAAVSFTATVSGSAGTPTGTVQFLIDNAPVGPPQTLSGGSATYSPSLASLSSGAHNISAAYSGDGSYSGSKGTLLGPVVNKNLYPNGQFAMFDVVSSSKADFGFTPCTGTATTVTVQPGATASGVTLTVTPANGFTGSVNFTATNNDGLTGTATFTPPTVNVTTGAVTTSLVVQAFQTTTAQLTRPGLKPQHPSGKVPWYAAGSGATLACMLLFLRPRRRRWGALLAAVLSIALFTAAGCGGNTSTTSGGGGGGGGSTTTPASAGTYTFTITAVSGTLVHSTQVTVVVQ
ncbi:MAG: protease pro-enzyme activation domain-containing protein [Edaphobacter sp.]